MKGDGIMILSYVVVYILGFIGGCAITDWYYKNKSEEKSKE